MSNSRYASPQNNNNNKENSRAVSHPFFIFFTMSALYKSNYILYRFIYGFFVKSCINLWKELLIIADDPYVML